jgi:hypothetical protein
MDGRKGTVISRFATKNEALAQAKQLAKKDYPTAEIEGVETQGDTIAEYKTSTGTPKFVGKYQFTPFVEGSISGWFIRVQGFAREVGFVEKPASKNTKTSTAPYKVYFHTETLGHPQLKATALPGNETRVIQSNQFRFAPKQLLKGVAMWMDAYGYRMVGEGLESVEVDGDTIGDTIAEGSESYDVEGTVDHLAGGQRSARTMQEAEHYAKVMLDLLKKGSPKAKKITVVIYKVVNYQRKDTPEKVLTVTEGIGDDITEAKKQLTPAQRAALRSYNLSCDLRDRDDNTPDDYRHYEKRAKADAEACKKLGLGKEDGVYESVEVAEATAHWLRNSKRPLLGTFTHATTGVRFDYRMSDDDYGKKHGLPHEVHVGVNSTSGETRPALVKGTVCIIGVDEGADGKPVLEKWKIKQHIIYPLSNFEEPRPGFKWTKRGAHYAQGEEFESEEPSLIEATYSKSKAKKRKQIADGIKKFINGEIDTQDLMRLIGAESKDHPTMKKAMAKMNDRVGKRITIDWKA